MYLTFVSFCWFRISFMTNLLSPKIQHQQKVYLVLAPKEGTAVIHIILKCPLVAVHERRWVFWPSDLSSFLQPMWRFWESPNKQKSFLQNLLPIFESTKLHHYSHGRQRWFYSLITNFAGMSFYWIYSNLKRRKRDWNAIKKSLLDHEKCKPTVKWIQY